MGEAERAHGTQGFGQAQEDIERVSQQKAEVDELKGRTLEEMSQVVGEINEKIKKRKHQLAPQIMRLRKLRTEVRDKETVYTEKKQAFNAAKAGIDSDLSAVQEESNAALQEAAHEESQAAYYESAASIERVKLSRAADEKAGASPARCPTGPR